MEAVSLSPRTSEKPAVRTDRKVKTRVRNQAYNPITDINTVYDIDKPQF